MSTILTVLDLEKSFGPRPVLRGVSLSVHDGDRIGVIGRNGSGKSTLLKLLVAARGGAGLDDPDEARQLEPDGGTITWRRDLTLEYVSQAPHLPAERTVGELLARGGSVAEHQIHTMAVGLELPPLDARIDTLSLGQRRRVALGRALLGKADVLALDEPTNHLDADTVAWLEERLEGWPGALLLVTHDRYFLDRVATRIVELDRGALHAHDGDYSSFLVRQAERLAGEAVREHQRAMFVRREIEWIRRRPPARTTKAKARVERFEAAVAARPGMIDRLPGTMELRLPTGGRLGRTILELDGLSRTLGGKRLFDRLTLVMKPGDRIGIVGKNGAGKTTLLRTILGEAEPDAGKVVLGLNTTPAYLEQGRSELDDAKTVLQEVAGGSDHVALEDGPVHVRTFLRMMQFDDATADTPIGKLSGGERNRVQLARLLRRGGNLLVLDEPTNDLDLLTLGVLEQALLDFPGCALIVSHDRWFLDRVATGILAFEGDGRVVFHEGNYTAYHDRREAAEAAEAARPERGATGAGAKA
ncbi:MAG TPA: ABC-F family ATP-binding cassette domain-containing protein, partial [Kofleriaceae bacterium]|nr:ABC-F family ATP-binding cassette domain-containing protein [Kofleriaceae bacterium]